MKKRRRECVDRLGKVREKRHEKEVEGRKGKGLIRYTV